MSTKYTVHVCDHDNGQRGGAAGWGLVAVYASNAPSAPEAIEKAVRYAYGGSAEIDRGTLRYSDGRYEGVVACRSTMRRCRFIVEENANAGP